MFDPSPLLHNALELHRAGQLAEAAELYRQVLEHSPEDVDANNLLGDLERRRGNPQAALEFLDRAIRLSPQLAMAHYNRGNALLDLKDWPEAIGAYGRAIALNPDGAEFHANLGVALQYLGDLGAAVAAYRRALELTPARRPVALNLASCLRRAGRLSEARETLESILSTGPEAAEIHAALGQVHRQAGDFEASARSYRQSLNLAPDQRDCSFGLALAVQDAGRFAEAEECFRSCLARWPGFAEAWCGLGNLLSHRGRIDEAISAYRQALAVRPGFPPALYSLVYRRLHICDWPGLDAEEEALRAAVRGQAGGVLPYTFLSVKSTAAEQLLCARTWAAQYRVANPFTVWGEGTGGKLRLGYISADFRSHATAFLTCEMFERHDRGRFEVIAYSYGPDEESPFAERVRGAFDRFENIRGLSPQAAAARIHADGVHILVDLMGCTGNSAQPILAHRPAPIQVNFLVSPGTLGAEWIDYIIVDPIVIPDDQLPFLTEKAVRLPHCYQPNDTRREIAGQPASRAQCGLPEDGFVFCCFNNSFKIRPELFEIWMRLLKARDGGVLWLLESNGSVERNLRAEAEARGVDPGRLIFAPRLPLDQHMARHRLADLFLDTLPYNAHTTASDALWVGLPVVTCLGSTFPGRVAASLLQSIGLPELITEDLAGYERLAARLAGSPEELQAIRARLAAQRLSAPLFDTRRFTRNIEAAFLGMWQARRDGRPVEGFSVMEDPSPSLAPVFDIGEALGQAVRLYNQGDLAAASGHSRAILGVDPHHQGALEILGRAQHRQGDLAGAVASFETLLGREPRHLQGLTTLAAVRYSQKDYAKAERHLDAAIRIWPDSAEAFTTLGAVLMAQRKSAEAELAFRTALVLDPGKLDALNNLGAVLQVGGRLDEALPVTRAAVERCPEMASAFINLGNTLVKAGRTEEGLAVYRQGLERHGEAPEFRCNLANVLLLSGHLREGLAEYEWRRRLPEFSRWKRDFSQPEWRGQDLRGKTLLIHVEQGLGDIIQFSRYVGEAVERGAKVVLEVYPPLLRLMQNLSSPVELVIEGQALPPFDTFIPLLSLPLAFGAEIGNIPANIPYLSPPADGQAAWKERIGQIEGLKVGIVWAGSPHHNNNANRSLRFADFAQILAVPGVTFLSLQKQLPQADSGLVLPEGIVDLAPFLGDMADTAGAIAELDLVISVDTAVAHLAGALGKPVWILIPQWPDWRWMLDGDGTPWYPAARLFRQGQGRDWSATLGNIAKSLSKWVNSGARPEKIS